MKKKNNLFLFATIFFMIFVISYSLIRDTYRKNMLKNTRNTLGILVKISPGTAKHSMNGTFQYVVNNEIYSFTQYSDYSSLSIGDTVEIEYSIEDNSVARVINKHYMNKYR